MKVYEIVRDFTPKTSRHREYALLDCVSAKDETVCEEIGRGQHFLPHWKPIRLYVFNPAAPRSDFSGLDWGYVCNERALDVAAPFLEKVGELLPVSIEGEAGTFRLFNFCHAFLNAFEPTSSIYQARKDTGLTTLKMPAFQPEKLQRVELFKDSTTIRPLFYVEHDSLPVGQQFRHAIEKSGLTGIKFELAWTEGEGPALPDHPWDIDDPWEYRRHDGSPWVFSCSKWPVRRVTSAPPTAPRPSAKKQKRASK